MNEHGAAVFVFLAGALLAFPAAWFALWLYGRAVGRITRERARPGASPPAAATTVAPRAGARAGQGPALRIVELSGPAGVVPPRCAAALSGPWVEAAIYATGGLAWAALTAWLELSSDGNSYSRNAIIVFTAFRAWPIVPTTLLVAAPSRRAAVAGVAGYALLLLLLWQLPRLSGNEVQPLVNLGVAWSITNLLPTLLVVVFTGPSLRAVGPMVLAFMLIAMAGTQIAVGLFYTSPGFALGARLAAVEGATLVMVEAKVLGFLAFGALGWGALGWIRRRYAGKRMSDESIAVDSLWLVFTAWAALDYAWRGAGWAAASPLPFVAYKAVTSAGMALRARAAGRRPPVSLVLLRVFGDRARSEALFRAVATPWRHAGPIELIAGTDLAASNLEPHEFLAFLTGKLRRLFVHGPEELDQRLRERDVLPDRDGRYRVAEYLCFDDTWRMAVSRVIAEGDAVLLDLRGFSAANHGVAFELALLLERVPLERLVLLADPTTDLAALEETARAAWARLSADSVNAARAGEATLLLARRGADRSRRAILAALFRSAEAGAEAGHGSRDLGGRPRRTAPSAAG